MTREEAQEATQEWGRRYAARDDLIRQAHQAGMNKREIARAMRIGRNTVYDVLSQGIEQDARQALGALEGVKVFTRGTRVLIGLDYEDYEDSEESPRADRRRTRERSAEIGRENLAAAVITRLAQAGITVAGGRGAASALAAYESLELRKDG